jgi:methyl-accepting chemotaxis protein
MTGRSVQAIKKIAATIEQLSDVANDVSVAMRQQDAVTQEIARNAVAAAKGGVTSPKISPMFRTAL